MSLITRLSAGLTGAVALNVIHETVRQFLSDAPRMDIVGQRGLAKLIRMAGGTLPAKADLNRMTLYGDVASNTLFYSFVGTGAGGRRRGLILGFLAGVGALVLPKPLGLGEPPHVDSARNRWLTVAYYTIGGLIAGSVAHAASKVQESSFC